MQIQVNTDNHIDGNKRLIEFVQSAVGGALDRFASQITRVEVHLNDENSSQKSADNDHRCAIEARVAGLQPITVSHRGPSMEAALNGCTDKLVKSLDKTLGKLSNKKGRTSYGGDQTI
ncbi:MAG: HPF/RaiA family ribosome-associated protein [Planctomyces sp.]|nr:HPF/RaiA family ribosome-associated protein [Planctomyces sp.]